MRYVDSGKEDWNSGASVGDFAHRSPRSFFLWDERQTLLSSRNFIVHILFFSSAIPQTEHVWNAELSLMRYLVGEIYDGGACASCVWRWKAKAWSPGRGAYVAVDFYVVLSR